MAVVDPKFIPNHALAGPWRVMRALLSWTFMSKSTPVSCIKAWPEAAESFTF